jgi:hypothetical protein
MTSMTRDEPHRPLPTMKNSWEILLFSFQNNLPIRWHKLSKKKRYSLFITKLPCDDIYPVDFLINSRNGYVKRKKRVLAYCDILRIDEIIKVAYNDNSI